MGILDYIWLRWGTSVEGGRKAFMLTSKVFKINSFLNLPNLARR